MADDGAQAKQKIHPAAIAAGVLVVLLVVFVLQNTRDAHIDFLWMSTDKPLWLVIVVVGLVAVAVREIIAFVLRRRGKD